MWPLDCSGHWLVVHHRRRRLDDILSLVVDDRSDSFVDQNPDTGIDGSDDRHVVHRIDLDLHCAGADNYVEYAYFCMAQKTTTTTKQKKKIVLNVFTHLCEQLKQSLYDFTIGRKLLRDRNLKWIFSGFNVCVHAIDLVLVRSIHFDHDHHHQHEAFNIKQIAFLIICVGSVVISISNRLRCKHICVCANANGTRELGNDSYDRN